jgi:PAS domain S-box-containing protein
MAIPLKVLLVEDRPADAELLLLELRRAGYAPEWQRVDTEKDYLQQLNGHVDLVLADYRLPQFDGLRALELLNERNLDVPFILVSGSIGEELAVAAMKSGAADYLLKDRPARLGAAVTNVLEQRRLRQEKQRADADLRESEARLASIVDSALDAIISLNVERRIILFNDAAEKMFRCTSNDALGRLLDNYIPERFRTPDSAYMHALRPLTGFSGLLTEINGLRADGVEFPFEASISQIEVSGQTLFTVILRDITERKRAEADIRQAHAELEEAYEATLEGWSKALGLRDQETESHTLRVTAMTLRLARVLGIPEEQIIHVKRGAVLHDIGKVGIPDSILLKPGPLNEYEWAVMRLHPGYAYQMLAPITYLRPALDIPYCHHERWDGNGYPRGLKGNAIPLAARIFAVVDVWDALSFDRPYRPAWSADKVLNYIRTSAGAHFDPQVVEAFLKLVEEKPPTGLLS